MKAVITGALGFIGRNLAERLEGEGWETAGVDLTTDSTRSITAGDLTTPGPWASAFEGAEVAFHTAAAVTNTASVEEGWKTNVAGTRNAIDAAIAAGARRFVHFSSVRAFGDSGFPDGVTERHPPRPDTSVYVNTKIASEQVVLAAHAAGEIEVTVIRPGDVYGPGSRPWTILIVEAIAKGQFALPAMGRGIFSPVYVDNLIDGVLLAATSGSGAGQVFTISDGTGVSTREFFGHYFRMMGRGEPRVLPTRLAVAFAAVPELFGDLTGHPTEVRRESIRYLARPGTYSIEKARSMLGYEPQVDLAEGMRRTEAWLRERGLI